MKAKIIGYSNVTSEGVTLHFDEKVAMNGTMKVDEWWVSWEKIGKSLIQENH